VHRSGKLNTYIKAPGCYNAGFQLDAPCTNTTVPCTSYDRSNFNNFYTAIYAANTGVNNYTFSIIRANFNNNAIGVYVNGVKNESILFNNFYLGPNYGDDCAEGSAPSFGINMLNSNGFAIEENTFQKASGAPLGQYVGIRCKDSNTPYDIIYKNTYNGLDFGNFADGTNRQTTDDLDGLEFQCNSNAGNKVDFIVTNTGPSNSRAQIRTFQGTLSIEAGNTFSTGTQLAPQGHFKNDGNQVIDYFYHSNPPLYYTPNYVVPIYVLGINTCPSHYEGGGGSGSGRELVLTHEQILQTEQDFAANLNNYNNVKALFDNLKDGGNTDGLKLDVETSCPSDMWNLRAELLEKSPHLSQEVLMAAADKTEVLPESILFEILSANPDELRKEELLDYLENKEQPLPEYLISILRQLAGGVTYKTILLQDLAKYKAAKSQAAYDLIRSCLNDTVTDHHYLRNWLDNLHSLNADMQIVSSFIEEGDYTTAETLLDLIPTLYELEGADLSDFNDFRQLMLWQISLAQQERTIMELDSTEIVMIESYAATDNMAGKIAKGILEFAYGFHYCNCLPGDSSSMKSSPAMKLVKRIDNGLFIEATPNPANTWVAFDYKIPDYAGESILQISDMKGNWVMKFTLTSKQGQQVWDVRDIQKGAYFYVLQVGNLHKSGKLIIE